MITCTFENNNKALLRHVTVNAIIIKDRQVLLGKRGSFNGKPISESGKWGLLGGFFDRDENLTQAVKQIKTSDEEVTELQWFDLDKLPEIAFDHGDSIELYKKYLKEKFILPILG